MESKNSFEENETKNGKLFYFSLKTEFFQKPAIRYLLSQDTENEKLGSFYLIIFERLISLSLNTNGELIYCFGKEKIPLGFRELAKETGYDESDISTGIMQLVRLGLLYENENGAYVISDFWDYVGIASGNKESIRKQKYRMKQMIENGQNVP